MPTYEYQCPEGHEFELFQKMSDKPRAKCPTCGKPAIRRISGGAGLVFKGSGFYITDYGKDGKGPRKEPGENADSGPAKDSTPAAEAKTDAAAKPDTRSSDKTAAKTGKQTPAKSSKKAAPE